MGLHIFCSLEDSHENIELDRIVLGQVSKYVGIEIHDLYCEGVDTKDLLKIIWAFSCSTWDLIFISAVNAVNTKVKVGPRVLVAVLRSFLFLRFIDILTILRDVCIN